MQIIERLVTRTWEVDEITETTAICIRYSIILTLLCFTWDWGTKLYYTILTDMINCKVFPLECISNMNYIEINGQSELD